MKFGSVVHELWSENPWIFKDSHILSVKWSQYFKQSNSDLEMFFSNFLIFPMKLFMLDPRNTKNATSMHAFCAMFDRTGLDQFQVQKFGLFLIGVKK